ncbi:MAG: IMP cyclohydrolase [Planctomycetota bacterium]
MAIEELAAEQMDRLRANPYPGRGIVIGGTPNGMYRVQVYWIMGRSANSRNRVFVQEGDVVRTAPFDESKVEDPSLIIYNCVRPLGRAHIVSNGDQTDTVFEALAGGVSFETALRTRTFEPDAPNYTPRIAGLVDLDDDRHAYQLAVLKAIDNQPDYPTRQFFDYPTPIPGVGHLVSTYETDGSPLPAFAGEPKPVELVDDIDATLELYWDVLDADNKVSLLVKYIEPEGNRVEIRIANKNQT